jgi:toxin FitB
LILVDTNIISEPTRREPSRSVLAFLMQHPVVALSAVSVLELEAGVRAAPAARRERLVGWLEALLDSGAVEVIPIDTVVARVAGRLRAELRKRPVATEDLLIGATAVARGMSLATRNTRHFARFGLSTINPFE